MAGSPRVFISYSHDNAEHEAWVGRLAGKLHENGVDIVLDQWDLHPGDSLAAFMESAVSTADRVLVICTDEYVQKADESRSGVGYEKMIVTAELLESTGTNKFIPVIRRISMKRKLPWCLADRMYVDFSDDQAFEAQLERLLREIHGVAHPAKPALGPSPIPRMPGRQMTESLLDRMNAMYRSRQEASGTQYWKSIQHVYSEFEAIHERYVASFRRIHAATREPGATVDGIIAFCREEYLFSETQRSKLREFATASLRAAHDRPYPFRSPPPARDAIGFPIRFFHGIQEYLTTVHATETIGGYRHSQRLYHSMIDELCELKVAVADSAQERRLLDAARQAVEGLVRELNDWHARISRDYFELASMPEDAE